MNIDRENRLIPVQQDDKLKRRQKTVGLIFLPVPTVEDASLIVTYSFWSRWTSSGDGHTGALCENRNRSDIHADPIARAGIPQAERHSMAISDDFIAHANQAKLY